MHNKFKKFSPFTFILLYTLIVCCNTNANNQPANNNPMQSFEITVRMIPNLPCRGLVYTVTNNNITIDADENKSTKPGEFNCIPNRVYQKKLEKTGNLQQLNSIAVDDFEVITNEACDGGIRYGITLKKGEKTKDIIYAACAKELDKNTKDIISYINGQVPDKYKINLK